MPTGTIIADPNDCAFVEKVEGQMGSLKRLRLTKPKEFIAQKEWRTINEMNNRIDNFITDHIMDLRVLWRFDLKNKEWKKVIEAHGK